MRAFTTALWPWPTPSACTRCCSAIRGPGGRPGPRTERVTLFAVGVDGVPDVHIEEAVWIALEILGPSAAGA